MRLKIFRKSPYPEKRKETPPEFISGLALNLITAFFVITFVIHMFAVPSSSMERTINVGDHMFVDELTPHQSQGLQGLLPQRPVHRGEILCFYSPAEPGKILVKRIIAVPGDRIHLRKGVVYLNGVAQKEPYVIHSVGDYDPYRDDFPSGGIAYGVSPEWPLVMREHIQGDDLVIPPGHYFGMGDNRENSLDSRYWGFIPEENIVGRPLFNVWSFDASEQEYEDETPAGRAHLLKKEIVHFFDDTRWSRTLHRIK